MKLRQFSLTSVLAIAGCHAPVDDRGLVGKALPHLQLRDGRDLEAVLPQDRCRIMTVTVPTCGVSKSLARGWVEEIAMAIDSAKAPVFAAWVVFGAEAQLDELFELVEGQRPVVFLVRGRLADADAFLGMRGVPHTLLIDAHDTVRAVESGNRVPDAKTIAYLCESGT